MTRPLLRGFFVLLAMPLASAAATVEYPDDVAGRRAKAYFEAFNAEGDAAMRAFIGEHVAAASLAVRPAEARLAVYRQMKSDLGKLEPEKVLRAGATSIAVLARTKEGKVMVELRLDDAAPHGVVAIVIDDAGGPEDEAVSPLKDEREMTATLDAWLTELASRDEMSGVVLVARGGEPVFERAYGMASREHRVKNHAGTRFCVGSISKLFTKIAILQLADAGKLGLEDRLGKHLPDYPSSDARQKVTIQHLLDMSSGIGDFFGEAYDATPKDRIRRLQDYLPSFAAQPLQFEPGSERRYSNGGFVVLGLVVEKVAGRSYYDHVRDAVFAPAGVERSGWFESDVPEPDVAMGYTREGCPDAEPACRRTNIYSRPARGSSAGGSYATAADLLRIARALEEGKLLSPARTKELLAGGLGIAGGAPGMNGVVESGLDGGYTIVVLCNEDPPMAERVGRRIRGWLPRS